MRRSWMPLVVSSLALAGGVAPAAAQNVTPTTRPTAATHSSRAQTLGPELVEPTIQNPGIVSGITLGELFTDNLRLAGPGQAKQSGFITEIRPFVKAAYAGNRLSGVLDYELTGYVYAKHTGDSQLAQHLNTHGTLTMLPNHLFLDGSASYGRHVINNRRPAGSSTFFLSNNRANVATASLSPYWIQGLGGVGTMTLRYVAGRVVYNRNGIQGAHGNLLAGISDATIQGVDFSIVSPQNDTWGWVLAYTGERVEPDNRPTIRFATARVELSRGFGLHTRVLVDFGKENRFLPDGSVDTLASNFWDVGIRWADLRNSFLLKGGHRFYGHSAHLSWTHTASRLSTHLSYEEQPTDLNQQLMGTTRGGGVGLNLPQGVSGIPSLLDRRVYLMKRASASAALIMPNGRLSLTLYNESRNYFLRGAGSETVSDAHLSWRFDVGAFTWITPTVGWQRYRFTDHQINYTRYFQLEARHKITRSDSVGLRLRHDSRSTHAPISGARGYKVNVIYLSWTHLFGGG